MQYQLSISQDNYNKIQHHLYPGDGLEAVAILVCGRLNNINVHKLLVNSALLIPHKDCVRQADYVAWTTELLLPLLEKASKHNQAIVKIHSHPGGYAEFSELDDNSDNRLFSSVFGWIDSDDVHGSCVLLPDGRIFGRVFHHDLTSEPIGKVNLVGDSIKIWRHQSIRDYNAEIAKRTVQAFGEATYSFLKNLKVGIIGCSGTGSPTIEQLVRLGVGHIVIVDPDRVELKNLNRILNTKLSDAVSHRLKVEVIKEVIESFELETRVSIYSDNLYDNTNCLKDLAECDLLFGCVDSIDGRDLINRLATYYLIPYYDLGVKLDAGDNGNISKIVGTVHYVQPGKSSLMSRGVYDAEDLKASGLFRLNPEQFPNLVKNSYIKNIHVERPAVISVNMLISSYAINEFLNRIHQYKVDPSSYYAQTTIDLTEGCFIHVGEHDLKGDNFLLTKVGLGDKRIFLDMVELTEVVK